MLDLFFFYDQKKFEQLHDITLLAQSERKTNIPSNSPWRKIIHTVSQQSTRQPAIQCSNRVLLWFIVCIGLHDQIQLCHTVASLLQLLSAHFSLRTQMGHWREAQSESPTKIFESVSSKRKSLGALGDSGGKIERFILAFCHGFNLSYFCELGPLGVLPMALDRAARTTKEESLLFIHPGLGLAGLRWPSIGRADKHKELLVEMLTMQSSYACQLPAVSTKTLSVCVSALHYVSCTLNASCCHALHQSSWQKYGRTRGTEDIQR